ncbi:hypothetical protein GCM10017786_05890 [Amycolatopsis deserti]|uniref:Secreted protein n=1 Tax=Amycolatopsis deserti TaxID=185696 RepID=A0ABQ3IFB1_9PSEU|nr:hypothetical protein GCM10017786_05890 [Amycolatopsis deserti]
MPRRWTASAVPSAAITWSVMTPRSLVVAPVSHRTEWSDAPCGRCHSCGAITMSEEDERAMGEGATARRQGKMPSLDEIRLR